MVLEVALIDVTPGVEEAFCRAYAVAREQLAGSDGCVSVRMTQGIESPSRFVLMVEWDSIADHEAFRASPAFTTWRQHLGPLFAVPPRVEHFEDVNLRA